MKDRDKLWPILERNIQNRALNKDPNFLKGEQPPWKGYVRNHNGFRIYAVDGKYVRDNLCIYFGHGGHGLVHEFIPMDEIWISTHHYDEGDDDILKCNCRVREKNGPVSKEYFESCVVHETSEFEKMKKSMPFEEAHDFALDKEKEAGFLKDPHTDL